MSRLYCGVDFGTTNSTVGLCARGSDPFLIPIEGDHVTIPSALFFSLEDGSVHFGRSAVHEYMDGAEGRFMRALKSILGTVGLKFNPTRSVLVSAHLIATLSDAGLRRRLTPVLALDYSF